MAKLVIEGTQIKSEEKISQNKDGISRKRYIMFAGKTDQDIEVKFTINGPLEATDKELIAFPLGVGKNHFKIILESSQATLASILASNADDADEEDDLAEIEDSLRELDS